MSNVVALPVRKHKAPAPIGNQWFCTRCDSETFRVFSTGNIHCANCGARMRNLFAEKR